MLPMRMTVHTGTPLIFMVILKNLSGNGTLVLFFRILYESLLQVQTHGEEE
jgi:hypothetical protein